ncbi:MAG TPA: hypothetical protein PK605_06260 [Ignavibacteria bacterium]|nr:hypothetical protein [Ignavibacteria bacterium]HRF65158.1 hypothetical protein [Ignavibacteria bacterium]HRJ03988.1 hypothetical protein [Ignavibacteria bacterium]
MVVVIKKTDSKRTIERKIKSVKPVKSNKIFNAYKYLGKLKIKEDPNDIQKKLRDEWE